MGNHAVKQSCVVDTPAASCEVAMAFFASKLSYETDPADVYTDMQNGVTDFVLLDVRSPEAFAKSHAVGAINLPRVMINHETTAPFDTHQLLVVYCWGPGCNGATKAALTLSRLGFAVKEMIGGIEYWEGKERYPVDLAATLDGLSLQDVRRRIIEQVPEAAAAQFRSICEPVLINRYRRQYFESFSRRVRITIDRDLEF